MLVTGWKTDCLVNRVMAACQFLAGIRVKVLDHHFVHVTVSILTRARDHQ